MRIFISWSGDLSQSIADIFRQWIPGVIQAAKFSKSEMKKVIKMINNELDDQKLDDNVLDSVFNKWWPDLEEKISNAVKKAKVDDSKDLRSDRDILEEVLFLSRELSMAKKNKEGDFFDSAAFSDLIVSLEQIILESDPNNISRVEEQIDRIFHALHYILNEGSSYWGSSFKTIC